MTTPADKLTRRDVLRGGLGGACLLGLGGVAGWFARPGGSERTLWQIDPHKCIACGNCAVKCVLPESAVKCSHAFSMCGRCDFCFGYYRTPGKSDTGGERQLCPTNALIRHDRHTARGDVFHEYTIDDALCIGCAVCVKDCGLRGNGSLYLQVKHDRCANCNECSIAAACPSQAFVRVPASRPYLPKDEDRTA
ncbi:MAG: ferredoxin [Planctomycetota bacterium]